MDIPGSGDAQNQDGKQMKLVVEENKKLGYMNAFLFVVNGKTPRFDQQIQSTILLYNILFGQKFLENSMFVFTNWATDQRSIIDR